MLREADKVNEYLKLGMSFESLELDMEFKDYLNLLFRDPYKQLKKIMKDYDVFKFLMAHYKFKKAVLMEIIKENSYPLLLIVLTYFLSWFFILFFTPNVISLVRDFDISIDTIVLYQLFVKSILWFYHISFLIFLLVMFLLQFKDLKTILFILLSNRIKIVKTYISYRFALMLLLFLEAGIKTQSLIQIMREYGLGDLSKWMSYHIQESLDRGEDFKTGFDTEYIDKNLKHFINLGIMEQDLENALRKYLILAEFEMKHMIKKISTSLKLLTFLVIIILLSLFYLVLYYPLGIMEAL